MPATAIAVVTTMCPLGNDAMCAQVRSGVTISTSSPPTSSGRGRS
jgi:hypothetical protein